MKILVISENIPRPDISSGDRRFFGILQILAREHEVVFCIPPMQPWIQKEESERYFSLLEQHGIRVLPINQGWYDKTLTEEKYDIGFFEFFWVAERYMDKFIARQPKAILIVDSVDLHFAREEIQSNLGLISKKKVRITRRRELLAYRMADITIAVSQEDLHRLEAENAVQNVALIPNIVPTVPRVPGRRDPILIFIGCYAWPPNVDAMKWFVEKVWPLVLKGEEKARLMIVGSHPPDEITSMSSIQGVEVVGYVEETAPYLDAAAVSIAPLRYGGGMKGKVNEAFAHGLPVVATSIGAQGFNATNGHEMFIADDPAEFADDVIKLLKDSRLQHDMGIAGQLLNEKLCSPAVIEQSIRQMTGLSALLNKSADQRPEFRNILKLKLNRLLSRYYWKNQC